MLRLVLDLGSEERQVVAGLGEWYDPSELVGKLVVVVANLKPKKIFGVESQGMILATCVKDRKPALVTVDGEASPGDKIC